MTILFLCFGFILLIVGGEFLLRGAVTTAQRFNVSPLLIGLTVVGFGTSTPELVTSVNAALQGSPGIAVGNVVGSNIANVFLIIGLAALIAPLATNPAAFRRDGATLLAATALLLVLCQLSDLTRWGGALFVALLLVYICYCYLDERRTGDEETLLHQEAAAAPTAPARLPLALLFLVLGLAGVLIGAKFLVDAAIDLARFVGVSEAVIGLTLVAVGTSLPELVTSVMAALRKQPDVALGNVIGSNIFNALGIMGTTALIRPLSVPQPIARFDSWVMMAAALLLVIFAVTHWRIGRREGLALLFLYLAYTAVQVSPQARNLIGLG